MDYRLKKRGMELFGQQITWDTERYRLSFKFKVLNGKAMGYIFDLKSDAELANNAVANDGFKISLANSKSVKTKVERAVWSNGAWDSKGVETVNDGKEFTKKGRYTITFSNDTVSDSITKVIYVNEKKHE